MLAEIVAHKKSVLAQIDQVQEIKIWEKEIQNLCPARDFRKALENKSEISLIAEIKRASPSAGILKPDLDVIQLATIYEQSGASCISVLTEDKFFQGSKDDLKRVKACARLPVLRKDFILTEYQVWESKVIGADCLLLIAAVLTDQKLKDLHKLTLELGVQALVEIHTVKELERALNLGGELIGINNRNLQTFQVDLKTTEKLLPLVPEDSVVVSESGISSRKEVESLENLGVDAILVGEALIKGTDPELKIKELLGKEVKIRIER
jgi:indole-3-glycerol phosphate synthase